MDKPCSAGPVAWLCLWAGVLFIFAVPGHLFAQPGKLDPRLRSIRIHKASVAPAQGIGPAAAGDPSDPTISLFLRLRPGVTREMLTARYPGAQFGVLHRRILTARVRVSLLDAFDADADIEYAEASVRYRPATDVARSAAVNGSDYLGVLDPNSTNFGTDMGQGVVIGLVDTGIDWDHYDFRDDGDPTQSRILYIWDQTDNGGPNPGGFAYGSEWTQANINNEIDGSPAGVVRETDTNGHGTHVAGTAAGDGSGSDGSPAAGTFVGMAPKADIIMVKTTFDSGDIKDGVDYIIAKAAAAGKRAVVNLSLSGQSGAHDGTALYEQQLNTIAASTPVIIAMGNDQAKQAHASYTYSLGETHDIIYNYFGSFTPLDIELWAATNDAYDITIIDDVNTPVSAADGVDNTGSSMGTATVDIYNGTNSHPAGDKQIWVRIGGTISQSNFTLRLTRKVSSAGNGRLDAYAIDYDHAKFTSDVDATGTIGSPAVIANGISVGSYCSKNAWFDGTNTPQTDATCPLGDISEFSNRGPTRDSRQKPDLTAPGERITAARSTDASIASMYIAQDNRHRLAQGTSMASPIVAGAIAVKFQQNPGLTAAQVKSDLRTSARGDTKATGLPNGTWGYGKMKILACGDTVGSAPAINTPTTLGTSSISWTWSAVTDAASYNIYYATDTSTLITNVASPSFTFENLQPNTTYGLEIRGSNDCGEGAGGVSQDTATLTVPVSAVTFAAEISSITVSYTALPGQNDGYLLYASTDPNFTGTILSSSTLNSSLAGLRLDGLSGLTTYYFRLATLNQKGAAVFSTVGSTLTLTDLVGPGSAPFSNIDTDAIRSSWTLNGNPAGLQYSAYASTAPDFNGTLLSSQTRNLYADFTGLSVNTTYYFQVRAATGPFGLVASTSTLAATPGAASPFTGVFFTSATAHWTTGANPSGTRMLVESSTEAGFGTLVDSSNTLNTSWLLTGLFSNTTVYVRAAAINNNSVLSAYRTLSTSTFADAPGLPAGPFASVTSSITARWTPLPASPSSTTCEGYLLEASTSPDFNRIVTSNRTTDASESSLGVEGLLFQTTYYLRVGALNWQGAATYLLLGSTVTNTAILSSSTIDMSSNLVLTIEPSVLQLDRVEVNIPPGAFADGVNVTVNASVPFDFDISAVQQAQLVPLGEGVAVDIEAQGSQPALPVAIRMDYDPDFLPPGARKEQLVIAHLRDGIWDVLETSNDTSSHILRAETRHFSLFAPFYVPAATALDNVQIFPIPWMPGSGDVNFDAPKLRVMNLPQDGHIRLYTILGELLWERDANASNMLFWDGRNKHGRDAGSGTYLAVISGGGARKVTRVVVIR